jgi:IS5 family transposase
MPFSCLMPREEPEEAYASRFSPTTSARAKPACVALGKLFINQRVGMTDEEIIEHKREKDSLEFLTRFGRAGLSNGGRERLATLCGCGT